MLRSLSSLGASSSHAGSRKLSSPSFLKPRSALHGGRLLRRSTAEERGKDAFPSDLLNTSDDEAVAQPVATATTSVSNIPYSVVTGIACAGLLETTYLTAVKLLGAPLVCPASGCESVLTSGYSILFGLPLPFFGMLAYATTAFIASTSAGQKELLSAVSPESGEGPSIESRLKTFDTALVAGAGALVGTSATLMTPPAHNHQDRKPLQPTAHRGVIQGPPPPPLQTAAAHRHQQGRGGASGQADGGYLLQTQLGGEVCFWCYLSATLAVSLLGVVASGVKPKRRGDAAFSGAGGFLAADFNPRARMYGAFWCSHCYEQKMEFGQQAMAEFPYTECFPTGWKKGATMAQACQDAGVKAFPSWVINGKLIEGELTLEDAEKELALANEATVAAAERGEAF
eukprot:gene15767-21890_t